MHKAIYSAVYDINSLNWLKRKFEAQKGRPQFSKYSKDQKIILDGDSDEIINWIFDRNVVTASLFVSILAQSMCISFNKSTESNEQTNKQTTTTTT